MGDLNCPAHHWYRHVQPSFSTEMVRCGQGHSCPPLCMGQAPPHILLHLAPAQQNRGCSAKLRQPASSWGVQTSCPRVVEGPRMSLPSRQGRAGRGGGEGPCQHLPGDMQHLPLQLPSQQQPGPTSNMQFAPESNIHCSWEKPHPFSLAGFSFSYGSTQSASPCSCP